MSQNHNQPTPVKGLGKPVATHRKPKKKRFRLFSKNMDGRVLLHWGDRRILMPKFFGHPVFRIVARGLISLLLVFVITGSIVASAMAAYVIKYVDFQATVDISTLKYSTIIYTKDTETEEYGPTKLIYSQENRIWVNISDLPLEIQHVVVAAEDKRFYDHQGVDWIRTFAAFGNLVFNFFDTQQGGSTITQQLIKNITDDREVSIERKVQEIMRALNLEKQHSKDEILEAYLNTLFLGYSCNGLQSASLFYFGKDAKDLSVAQAASIIAITQYPTRNNPLKNPENNKIRQEYILKQMRLKNWLSEEEYKAAVAEELVFVGNSSLQQSLSVNSYFEDQIILDVKAALVKQYGYTTTYAEWMIFNGGLRIYSTENQKIQDIMEAQYANPANFVKESRDEQPQSAMVVMGYNGEVVGIVGGKGEKTKSRSWSRATMSKRQPGSSIKPLTVYAPALDMDLIYWSQKVTDYPIQYQGKKWPKNYYPSYYGDITLEEAIQRSTNTVPIRVLQELTPKVSFKFATEKLHMTTLIESERINGTDMTDMDLAPLGLGALTDGVTVLEMAAAYQMLGNGGYYCAPYTFTRVEDVDGNVLIENKPNPTPVIGEDTAFILNQLLQTVVTGSHGTGRLAKLSTPGIPVAAKTGTTTAYNDRWFVGLTPYYVGVVWTGYDTKKIMNENLPNPSLDAWKKVMNKVHTGLAAKQFPTTLTVEKRKYCTTTGLIAKDSCPSTAYGWYKKDYFIPECTVH